MNMQPYGMQQQGQPQGVVGSVGGGGPPPFPNFNFTTTTTTAKSTG